MRGRSNADIIKVLYDHKEFIEQLHRRLMHVEAELRALKARTPENVDGLS